MGNNTYTVGREGVDIVLNRSSISRHHLTIELLSNKKVMITDNNSTNGTFLASVVPVVVTNDTIITLDTPLLVADYSTTPRKLLAFLPEFQTTSMQPDNKLKKGRAVKEDTSPFSRYIRDDSGSYKDR